MTEWLFRQGWMDPFREIQRVQEEMNRLVAGVAGARGGDFPPMNLWAGEAGVVVTARVPGVDPESLKISVHRNALTVGGSRSAEGPPEGGEALRRERPVGSFSRTVTLPFLVDADQVAARCDAGVLEIHLPRPEADRPRRIQIATA